MGMARMVMLVFLLFALRGALAKELVLFVVFEELAGHWCFIGFRKTFAKKIAFESRQSKLHR